jgi:hypothetical protein
MEQDEKKIRIMESGGGMQAGEAPCRMKRFFVMSRERQRSATFGQYYKVNSSNLIYSI